MSDVIPGVMNPALTASSGRSHSSLDFSALSELRTRAQQDEQGALREVAQQFESMFMHMVLKAMRDSVQRSDLMNSSAMETYESMLDQELAVHLAQAGGFGLANVIVEQMTQQAQAIPGSQYVPPAQGLPVKDQGLSPLQVERARRAYRVESEAQGFELPAQERARSLR